MLVINGFHWTILKVIQLVLGPEEFSETKSFNTFHCTSLSGMKFSWFKTFFSLCFVHKEHKNVVEMKV